MDKGAPLRLGTCSERDWSDQPRDPRGRPFFTCSDLGTILPMPERMPRIVPATLVRMSGDVSLAYRMVT